MPILAAFARSERKASVFLPKTVLYLGAYAQNRLHPLSVAVAEIVSICVVNRTERCAHGQARAHVRGRADPP